mgnify:CR=1 FL=1
MESVVARAGWWLVALFFAIFMFANAVDTGFAIHMAIFGLAALAGLAITLTKTNFLAAANGTKVVGDQSKYDDDLIRAGVILTTFWGVVGFLVGLVIATQLAFPLLNLEPFLNFGRVRPLHTSAVIFAFGGTALISTSFYIVQRTCRTRLAFPGLAKFVFWGYQLFIVLAATGYLLGITQGKEYAEPEWYVDLWLTLVWVAYLVVFVGTLIKRTEPHIYVANWFFLSFILTVAMLHLVNNALATGIYGSLTRAGYDLSIVREPAGCETATPDGSGCQVKGTICLNRPVKDYSAPDGTVVNVVGSTSRSLSSLELTV